MRPLGLITQKEAWEAVRDNCINTRVLVYDFIKANPGSSRREISNQTGLYITSVCARVKELLNRGSIVESGITVCPETGKRVSVLTVTETAQKISA